LWEDRGEQCGPEQGKFIALLYEEAHREPDSYVYMQTTRKWRRLAIPTVPNQSCSYTCSQIYMEYTPPETRVYSWKLAGIRNVLGCVDASAAFEESNSSAMRFGQISCEPRRAYVLEMSPIAAGSDLLKARVYLDSETYVYLGGEIFRDQKPDLSSAFWTKEKSSSGGRLVLAADLYVPDDHSGTFLWLDMRGRQSFDNQVADELFNPKAQQ
jgi:hypothetical protein